MNKTLYILRGVSGSGKTTLAKTLCENLRNAKMFAADDFFYVNGVYNFDRAKLRHAHVSCKVRVEEAMKIHKIENVILHNTVTTEREICVYEDLAKEYGYKIVSLVVENRHGNTSVHDVPKETLEIQESRLRNSLKLSNPGKGIIVDTTV